MTTFPNPPKLLKGGIVLANPSTNAVLRILAMPYNPDTKTRKLQVQGIGGEGGDRSEALRLKGPAVRFWCLWQSIIRVIVNAELYPVASKHILL